jgi:ribonuclease T2
VNSKLVVRVVVALVVAAVGAWQYQSGPGSNSSGGQHSRQKQGQGSDNPFEKPAGQRGERPQENQTTGDFDYYLASFSWSPAYCSTHPNDQTQCGSRGFGFILHGLWPQKSTGGYPQNCPANDAPTRATVERTMAFMPSEKLIAHEWRKHGTCTGLTAQQYFELADKAYASLKIPANLQAPKTDLQMSAEQIAVELTKTNPQIPPDSLTLRCSKGELEEVRVCLDTDLKPRSCGKGVRTQCPQGSILVRATR